MIVPQRQFSKLTISDDIFRRFKARIWKRYSKVYVRGNFFVKIIILVKFIARIRKLKRSKSILISRPYWSY